MTAGRKPFDMIVQSSTVELFQFYGVALAPSQVAVGKNRHHDIVGSVTFGGPSLSGVLGLSLPGEILAVLAGEPSGAHALADLTRELTNQLMGRIKNRLARYGVALRAGLSSVADARMRKGPPGCSEILYVFRALRGEVLVTLTGDLERVALVYKAAPSIPEAGEVILFGEAKGPR